MEKIGRREKERLIRKSDIISAAEEIFARRGFSATTMQEVANLSEFGMSTLYKFFSSKYELYCSVIDENLEKLHTRLAQLNEMQLDWRKAIERFISDHLQFFQENRHFFRIYMAEKFGFTHEPERDLESRTKARIAEYVEHAESALRRWIEQGHLGTSGARERSLALLSTLESHLSRWLTDDDATSAEERAALIMGIFFTDPDCLHAEGG
ncbi:MAG: TetR/AcrR family transcriptional regulator [Candidatus Coatesbacteria bacterium]|nr:TetR/AcrR family transcriptional regulator [Candidatus Coatesbacteria bacterium]